MSNDDSWKNQPDYVLTVGNVKMMMPSSYRPYVDQTSCFAWLWKDEHGECDQYDCHLRTYCQQAWQLVQLEKSGYQQTSPLQVQNVADYAETRALSKNGTRKRRKHKGTDLYKRRGYVPTGREVDNLLGIFVKALGPNVVVVDPVSSGVKWSKAQSAVGQVVIKLTTSYHAVIVNGIIVCRLWTNTPSRVNVDIAPELVGLVVQMYQQLGGGVFGIKYDTPEPIPSGLLKKLKPCTHRFYIKRPELMSELARVLRYKYNF